MTYNYLYEGQWQPENKLVLFSRSYLKNTEYKEAFKSFGLKAS
jgi:hypothetical protein